MIDNRPIGFFDSGVGGTSIWKEVHQLLPNENTIYLADSLYAPYGIRPKDEIIELSKKNTEFLLEKDCKLIVVACNTATTNAIDYLRAKYTSTPFIGIEPAIKPAAVSSKTNLIGVLATKGTISSDLFSNSVKLYKNTTIIEQIGYGLVQLIESNKIYSPEMTALLHQYLEPMIEAGIDYLVLGCSHYPYLIPQMTEILPSSIQIIDSGQAVARQTKKVLYKTSGFNDGVHPSHIFYTNSTTDVLSNLVGPDFKVEKLHF